MSGLKHISEPVSEVVEGVRVAEHTRGPFTVYLNREGHRHIECPSRTLAVVHGKTPEDAANAQLFASAPKLLEALDWLLGCIEATDAARAERLQLAKGAALNAIRQATGRS